jgi:hypothetical protein
MALLIIQKNYEFRNNNETTVSNKWIFYFYCIKGIKKQQDYKVLGKKNVKSLFSKIDSKKIAS